MVSLIEVLEKGFLTFPVSGFRHGLERFGLPRGGPMDSCRAILANRLVGNDDSAGTLEMTLLPPRLLFLVPRMFAVVGGVENLSILRDGQKISVDPGSSIQALSGDELTIGPIRTGLRAYLAVSGGILSTELRPKPLVNGMRLSLGTVSRAICPSVLNLPASLSAERLLLRVTAGVQRDSFNKSSWSAFYGAAYRCTAQSDRMGIRLSGAAVPFAPNRDGNIISEGMMPGDIQITSAGQPILMTADCQTVGGYAKIAHVIQADLPAVAQLRPGMTIRFRLVSVREAQDSWRKLWTELDQAILPK